MNKVTMGHNGTSGLCTFGRPYKSGVRPPDEFRL